MKKLILTGAKGFLGLHLLPLLQETYEVLTPTSSTYDLRSVTYVQQMLTYYGKVDIVVNLAANVGGIGYNQNHPYQLFYDNAAIGLNLIHECINLGVKKFVQIGTVCSYPKFARPPFSEEALWDGYPEETNAPYGLAKKMSLVQLQAARQEFGFNGIYLMPTNLYGPGDEFAEYKSHVIPALIKKFVYATIHNEKEVTVWGSGNASRDFLYVTDAAKAITLAIEKYNNPQPLNIGSGEQVQISALAYHIARLTGYQGNIIYDTTMPDGQPKRGLNINRIKNVLGWQPEISLIAGLAQTIEWYMQNYASN
jgi:GDP-L-fucose synthase